MKKISLLAIITILLISCNKSEEGLEKATVFEKSVENQDIIKLQALFQSKEFSNFDEVLSFSESLVTGADTKMRSVENIEISEEALSVVEKMQNIQVDTESSPEVYRNELNKILDDSDLDKNSSEYQALAISIEATIAAINYKMQLDMPEFHTRGFWSKAWAAVKCVGGTAGSAGLGALAGAGVGTMTVPVIGTVSGTALGGWSGALVGVATFC